jgi:hypothetical protein
MTVPCGFDAKGPNLQAHPLPLRASAVPRRVRKIHKVKVSTLGDCQSVDPGSTREVNGSLDRPLTRVANVVSQPG